MSYKDPSYVIFDGDNDKWAYGYMKGWKQNDRVDFDFRDAHDLDSMTGRAQDEAYVKSNLRERMKRSKVTAHPYGLIVDRVGISTSGEAFRVSRMASRTPMAFRRAVSTTDRMSA